MAKSGSARSRRRCRLQSGAARIAATKSPTTMWCATCSRSVTGTARPAAGPCRWKIFPAKASMPRWSIVQDGSRDKPGADARRGLHVAALKFRSSFRDARLRVDLESRRCDWIGARPPEMTGVAMRTPKRKRTNFRWPSMGINYPANRPDPDDPGGLGAEESGTERTGPTQDFFVAIQQGGRWAEVGRYYDSANDPVTAIFRAGTGCAASGEFGSAAGPLAAAPRLARSCRGR